MADNDARTRLTLHQGEDLSPTLWDARAEMALGTLIRRYLAENPPPPDSLFAPDLELWGDRLQAHGRVQLAAAGERILQGVADPTMSGQQAEGRLI